MADTEADNSATKTEPDGMAESEWDAWPVLLVLVLGTFFLYAPVRHFEFINYDDDKFVYANPHVLGGLTSEGLRWAFTEADIDYWRPLSWVTHMLDVELYGLAAGGHHVTNVMFHVLATCVLFALLRRLTKRYWESALVAALFAWHPLHVESVAWIAERKDVLCGFFWFSSIYFYARYAEKPGVLRFIWVLLLFLLGLMSKPMIITLPFQLLLLDVWPLRRVDMRVDWSSKAAALRELWQRFRWPMVEKLPLFGIVLISCATTISAQREAGTVSGWQSLSVERRLQNVPAAYGNYLQKTVYPAKLAVFYPLQREVDWTRFGIGVVLLVGGTLFVLLRLRSQPYLAVGWFWFVGTLVPVIGIVQVGGQSHADRYTYVALVGIFIALVWRLGDWIRKNAKARVMPGTAVAGILVLLCLVATRRQLPHWKDGPSVFRHAMRVTKDNYIACYNLAQYHLRDGEYEAAIKLLREADRILPNTHDVLLNLGTALQTGGVSLTEAYDCFQRAALARPGSPQPHNNLGNVLVEMGKPTNALVHYQKAIELDPEHLDTLSNLAGTLADLNRLPEAALIYDRALILAPRDLALRHGMVNVLSRGGVIEEAAGLAVETADMHPRSFVANYNAAVLLHLKDFDAQAIEFYERCLEIRPGDRSVLLAMAKILATTAAAGLKNPARALLILGDLERESPTPDLDLAAAKALALGASGRAVEARALAEQALQIARDNQPQEVARLTKTLAAILREATP